MKSKVFIKAAESLAPEVACNRRAIVSLQVLLASMRPAYWVKNSLVFVGLIFSQSMLQWEAVELSIAGFILFCMASSGVYLFNDLRDRDADRLHPLKRFRPVAAGRLEPTLAQGWAIGLQAGALLGAVLLSPPFSLALAMYVLLNLAYTLILKRVVIVDALAVAVSMVLRAVAGAWLVAVPVSAWLIVCTLSLGLFLSFGKRWHELKLHQVPIGAFRPSLSRYSPWMLSILLHITGIATLVTYVFYTLWPGTMLHFETRAMPLTIPFVLFGILRCFYLVRRSRAMGVLIQLLLTDVYLLVNTALWIAAVIVIIYG